MSEQLSLACDSPEQPGAYALNNAMDITRFALAGHSVLTVVSPHGTRYTYRIEAPHKPHQAPAADEPVRFVKLLSGPDNMNDYTYLGMIPDFRAPAFRLTKKSAASEAAGSVKAIRYLCERVFSHPDKPLPAGLQVWHQGKCGKCGRPLTVPESIERGIGPECWEKMGG